MFWYYWLLIAVGCIIIESFTTQFTFIWFAISSIFASLLSLIGWSNNSQLFVFVAVGLLLLILLRTRVAKRFNVVKQPTNSDALIGKKAKLIETKQGKVRAHVQGMDWKVRSNDGQKLIAGQLVIIEDIEGVTLIVKPVN